MQDTPQRDNLNATPKPLPDVFVMQKRDDDREV